jgi:hypothetical protein
MQARSSRDALHVSVKGLVPTDQGKTSRLATAPDREAVANQLGLLVIDRTFKVAIAVGNVRAETAPDEYVHGESSFPPAVSTIRTEAFWRLRRNHGLEFPLIMASWKIAPPLAARNTVHDDFRRVVRRASDVRRLALTGAGAHAR